ncbi:hypothetical protein BIFANG_02065 [Bifidobacterium angulatum DSM 20098 = JCM 7096]|uniref:Uncharacterized protein n=1 Tax=Bifidobacterium angulatum DSM 20098 = JCM 7096 TaxID=518635 RepID=C4FCN9_9BIFI|nr:hypothetical protein BIFANG_02065 [Bifidobacterium angulatum DSM 20098 = JCM 7096]
MTCGAWRADVAWAGCNQSRSGTSWTAWHGTGRTCPAARYRSADWRDRAGGTMIR